jgi:hypothetical protein
MGTDVDQTNATDWESQWLLEAERADKVVCFFSATYFESLACKGEFNFCDGDGDKMMVIALEPVGQLKCISMSPTNATFVAILRKGRQCLSLPPALAADKLEEKFHAKQMSAKGLSGSSNHGGGSSRGSSRGDGSYRGGGVRGGGGGGGGGGGAISAPVSQKMLPAPVSQNMHDGGAGSDRGEWKTSLCACDDNFCTGLCCPFQIYAANYRMLNPDDSSHDAAKCKACCINALYCTMNCFLSDNRDVIR